jgi:hypothetical protein
MIYHWKFTILAVVTAYGCTYNKNCFFPNASIFCCVILYMPYIEMAAERFVCFSGFFMSKLMHLGRTTTVWHRQYHMTCAWCSSKRGCMGSAPPAVWRNLPNMVEERLWASLLLRRMSRRTY